MRTGLKHAFSELSIWYLALTLMMAILLGSTEDKLFFKSDPLSIYQFLAQVSLGVLILSLPLYFLVGVFTDKLFGLSRKEFILRLTFSLLLFGFLSYSFESFGVVFTPMSLYLMVNFLLLFICLVLSWRVIKGSSELKLRVIYLSHAFLAVALLSFFLFQGTRIFRFLSASSKAKHVVLIIMDGLSPEYLNPYNLEIDTPDFAKLAERSLLYNNMVTNAVYTHGFFKILHSGRKDGNMRDGNLVKWLQEGGVEARWSSFHNNGVTDVYTDDYQGLRSTFLTQDFAWLPDLLGIPFHIFRYRGEGSRGRSMGAREGILTRIILERQKFQPVLENYLVDEITRLRSGGNDSFLLFHTTYDGETYSQDSSEELTHGEIWRTVSSKSEEQAVRNAIVAADYHYGPENEEVIRKWRDSYAARVRAGTTSLRRFIDTFFERNWDKDTLLLVTADHGSIYSRGRLWYGYHHDRGVTHVPLLLFKEGLKGKNDALYETVDLTKTILKYFDIEQQPTPAALSLLENSLKPWTTSLTNYSKVRGERLLAVHQADTKYVFNVQPRSNPLIQKWKNNTFERVLIADGAPVLKEVPFDIEKILRDYGAR